MARATFGIRVRLAGPLSQPAISRGPYVAGVAADSDHREQNSGTSKAAESYAPPAQEFDEDRNHRPGSDTRTYAT